MLNFFSLEKIFSFFNYVFWFFILNLIFLLLNISVISFFMFVGISNISTYFPLFLLSLIPIGPSFTMLLYCMGKIIRNKDLNIIEDIKLGFKLNFKQSTFIWIIQLLLILIINTNIRFFSRVSVLFSGISILVSIILLAITPYIYLVISRFSLSTIDVLKNSLILTFTKPAITIANISSMVFTLILFEISPGTTFLFMGSVLAFLLTYCNKTTLLLFEE